MLFGLSWLSCITVIRRTLRTFLGLFSKSISQLNSLRWWYRVVLSTKPFLLFFLCPSVSFFPLSRPCTRFFVSRSSPWKSSLSPRWLRSLIATSILPLHGASISSSPFLESPRNELESWIFGAHGVQGQQRSGQPMCPCCPWKERISIRNVSKTEVPKSANQLYRASASIEGLKFS